MTEVRGTFIEEEMMPFQTFTTNTLIEKELFVFLKWKLLIYA